VSCWQKTGQKIKQEVAKMSKNGILAALFEMTQIQARQWRSNMV